MTHEQHSTLPTGDDDRFDYDVIVVGSGFGGSVSALRLTEKGYRVGVLEAGRRFTPETLPKNSWDLRNFLWAPRLGLLRHPAHPPAARRHDPGRGRASAAAPSTTPTPSTSRSTPSTTTRSGGTSPTGETSWRRSTTRPSACSACGPTPPITPADVHLRPVAEAMGVGDTFHLAPVGVFFGDGKDAAASEPVPASVPDPYFGGAGPGRGAAALECGECMTGCRHGAKNTLDRELPVPRGAGRRRRAPHDHRDRDPSTPPRRRRLRGRHRSHRRLAHAARQPHVHRPPRRARRRHLRHAAPAARHARRRPPAAHLPTGSATLTRTNSEALVGATTKAIRPTAAVDFTQGVAITSSIHPDAHTHIEPVRYGKGSNAMGLLTTMQVRRRGTHPALAALPRRNRRATRYLVCAACPCAAGRSGPSSAWSCSPWTTR